MNVRVRRRALIKLPVLAALGVHGLPSRAAGCQVPSRLRFSIIPRGDVKKEMAELQPLLDKLQAVLGKQVDVYLAPSYGAVVEALLSGAVHMARLGPASYLSARRADPRITAFASYANKATAFQPAGAYYHSLLIVRADSGVRNIDAVRGRRLALVDPESTSGALIPRQVFARQLGQDLESYFSQVGYSGSHTQSVNKLLAGQVDAAFVGSQNLAAETADPAKAGRIRVIWRSARIPADPFVFTGQLCDELREKIRDAFFNRGGPQSAAVLDKLNVLRFVPVSDQDYQVLRKLY